MTFTFAHNNFNVCDLDKALAFYKEALGLRELRRKSAEDGSFIVCGARFQHHAALHIAMMGGNYDRCIDFAVNYAKAIGVAKVSCTFTLGNEKLEEALKARGFKPDASDLITKEIVF